MKKISLLIFLSVLLVSCGKKYHYNEGYIFGTTFHIIYESEKDVKSDIIKELMKVDNSLSSFNKNSIISKINRNENIECDSMFLEVYNKANLISKETNGAFDITVAPIVNAYGFGYKKYKTQVNIDSLMKYVGYNKISLEGKRIIKKNPNIQLITSAIAKGYGVDIVARFLEKLGIKNYLVEIGGETRCLGHSEKHSKWRIGIDKPIDDVTAQNRKIEDVIEMNSGSLATSGNYRNFYLKDGVKYAHTIDPRTGISVTHTVLSVSVKAKACMDADAYATAFMVLGLEESEKIINANKDIEALIIYSKGNKLEIWKSKGFK